MTVVSFSLNPLERIAFGWKAIHPVIMSVLEAKQADVGLSIREQVAFAILSLVGTGQTPDATQVAEFVGGRSIEHGTFIAILGEVSGVAETLKSDHPARVLYM